MSHGGMCPYIYFTLERPWLERNATFIKYISIVLTTDGDI